MVRQVQIQEETGKIREKPKFFVHTDSRDRRHLHTMKGHTGKHQGGQETENSCEGRA